MSRQDVAELEAAGKVCLTVEGQQVELDSEDLQVRLQAKPGWAAAHLPGCVVVLATELTPQATGQRLSGLDLRTFISESIVGRSKHHVEGVFYYPRLGIGQISERLADECGRDAIHTGAPITRLLHDGRAIHAVEIAGRERRDADVVVSSLPLNRTLAMLSPPPPPEVQRLSGAIRYRQVQPGQVFDVIVYTLT